MRIKGARVCDPASCVSNSGDEFHIEYRSVVQKDGTIVLEECGKTNIQEFIQSFLESTDMSYILKMIQLGDLSVLNARRGFYGDFSETPTSLAEFQQRIIDGNRAFMDLPVDVRNKYDHDVMKFLADVGSEKWLDVMKDLLPSSEVPVESEVSSDA